MKNLAIALAASLIGTAAQAQSTTVIEKNSGPSSTIVKERSVVDEPTTVRKEVTTTGSAGCSSKTVQKTDSFGDSKTKTKVEC